ncbi:MAG: transcription elongation factor GreA [Candidatus Vogelbacteria bacterium CG10_big_fil_rev_8_21_14_0_10_49_38]|uniref:Transcription elongation factor GreA n=1 Tax=Candidatus Vogelbacteria bacterium CG10_big_fil_rev_8_21_14_0_10_49_38 TaxID=1975043 RepID=A0A2H0RHL4_9BACT|nr:MAG: transcription elongation factor GreA [bacterium CG10_49_38]PIR45988.1 MAG: transcription elongation factor GreA [Candidatus Vogelbacteria bacterium CG10_big_fil_rev_8_21_14_0_10_49_38]
MADLNQQHYLTQEKKQELEQELKRLKTIERKKIAEDLDYAKSLGDLSENAEYHEARDKQADIEDRIKELEEILRHAKIIVNCHSETVEVGTTVVMSRDGGPEEEFVVVGSEEFDLTACRISYESPLGATLLGHKKGETVKVSTPRGEIEYKIIEIK